MKHCLLALLFITSFSSYSADQLTCGEKLTDYSKILKQQKAYHVKQSNNYYQSNGQSPIVFF